MKYKNKSSASELKTSRLFCNSPGDGGMLTGGTWNRKSPRRKESRRRRCTKLTSSVLPIYYSRKNKMLEQI